MADILHTLSIISIVLGVILIVIAVVLWFVLNIPQVFNDLSGRAAKKSIVQMRQLNEGTSNKSSYVSKHMLTKGNVTGTMEGIGQPVAIEETSLLNENLVKGYEEEATGLLLEEPVGQSKHFGETDTMDENIGVVNRKPSSIIIQLIDEVMLIHTEEAI
jgi:hypothetical protein